MGDNNLLSLICQQLEVYRLLVAEQKQKIELYLQGDLDLVKSSMERGKSLLEQIRVLNRRLTSELDGRTLSEIAAEMGSREDETLRTRIEELRRLTSELSRMNLQNHRYVQSSSGYTRAMLGEIFSENINYNQNGYFQTGKTVGEF